MEILKGGAASGRIKEEVAAMLEKMGGTAPKLAIVRVGENPDDLSYERGAKKKMENFGLRVQSFAYPKEISHEEFMREFQKVNEDQDVTGILLLCPLPGQIDQKKVAAAIDPAKDLDGISPVNAAKVFAGDREGFAPCTAEAVMEVLKTGGDRGPQHGGGTSSFHADAPGGCDGDHLSHQDGGFAGGVPGGGYSGGCRRTGKDAGRKLCKRRGRGGRCGDQRR